LRKYYGDVRAGVAGGGVAMAIARTGDTFRTLDAIGYIDPN